MPCQPRLGLFALAAALVCLLGTVPGLAQSPDTARMSWLLGRDGREALALTGQRFEQGDIGGGGGSELEVDQFDASSGRKKSGWPVLFSLVLPGAGEAYMGYTRGYFMMAADIFAWTQVAKYHSDGEDLTVEYLAFADEHYSDDLLFKGYETTVAEYDPERSGEGTVYFTTITSEHSFNSVADLIHLPLYVSKEDDFREYYENLGKWDQFIFGWDDYTRASIDYPEIGYVATGDRADLQHPWVSPNRDAYRVMRDEANDAYLKRDRWLYVNIGLRVFSVLQTAYLSGLLGGYPGEELEVAGHEVRIIAQPAGWDKGALAASVSF